MRRADFGFTLIELLVVIAIISLLSSVVLTSLQGVRQQARDITANRIADELERKVTQYSIDTGVWPETCRVVSPPCTPSNDPLLNNPGVDGWDGPYGQMYDQTHPWGGHIGFQRSTGTDAYFTFVFDDDSPDGNDNEGQIPAESIRAVDEEIDGGDGLKSGQVQACIFGISIGSQSFIYFVTDPNEGNYTYWSSCLDSIK